MIPSSTSVADIRSIASAEKTPSTCACAPAGLVSGPSRLKTVREPINFRAGAAWRAAVCAACANRNPIPTSRMATPTRGQGRSTRTPSASSTSADPLRELAARLPCFATRAPAAAATTAAGPAGIDHAFRAWLPIGEDASGMTPHHRSKSRNLRDEDRSRVQRSQKAHNLVRFHAAGKQFFHHGFGVGARKKLARLKLLDQRKCRTCGHLAVSLLLLRLPSKLLCFADAQILALMVAR